MRKMLSQLERQLEILTKRKRNLEVRMVKIDERPNNLITKDTYKEWHEVYCKVIYLGLRIEVIKSKMQMLAERTDIIKDVISGSKGLFKHLIRRVN